nr:hypothetical protein CFP56_09864 [Quercus suber]
MDRYHAQGMPDEGRTSHYGVLDAASFISFALANLPSCFKRLVSACAKLRHPDAEGTLELVDRTGRRSLDNIFARTSSVGIW